jgi:WS/DGAT/MGAT family acyltransferase
MTTHLMSPVDAAWYHIDGPVNLAMATGLLLTRQRLDFAKVRAVYKRRLVEFDRFRQRVVERGVLGTPLWEDVADFDIDRHLHHIALPAPHDRSALAALVDDLASLPLDHSLPLWQVHVVDDVEGGSALIMRYHHCIGDGTAMMAVIQRLFDTTPDAPLAGVPAAGGRARARLRTPGIDAVERSARKALATVSAAADLVSHPQQLAERAAVVIAGAGMLVKELLKWPDPKSPLKGEFRMSKRVAWSAPVPIADVKAIGAPSGAKVNDVLVAAMTGALRAYLKRRGVDVDHTTVRAMVPVDLRPPERLGELGNEFGLVVLDLAVTRARARDRLAATKARMDALKRSPEAVAMHLLFDLFGRGPKPLEDLATQIFGSKASLVMTNVVGPRETLYLAGTPIDRMMFWVPHPGRQLGMGISILSYRGQACLAVIADARLVPDPEAITLGFEREFAAMRRRAATAKAGGGTGKAAGKRPAAAAAGRTSPASARRSPASRGARRQTRPPRRGTRG